MCVKISLFLISPCREVAHPETWAALAERESVCTLKAVRLTGCQLLQSVVGHLPGQKVKLTGNLIITPPSNNEIVTITPNFKFS